MHGPRPHLATLSQLYCTHARKALATPRRPSVPEGHRARTSPQHASWAWKDHTEHIVPGHLGPAGALHGGWHHGATILGLESSIGHPRGSELAEAAHVQPYLPGLPRRAPWRRQADGRRCPMPRHARAPHRREKTSTAASNAACEGATRRPAPSESACTPLDPEAKERLETSSKLVKPKRNGPILWKQGG